jgi:octaprenyl-diphosphate synthase
LATVRNLTGKEVLDLIRTDLQKVEEEFCRQSLSRAHPIAEIGQYLQVSGGKRLRPALLLLSAKLCGYDGPAAVRLGTVMELIHTATLIHDDVIDEADKRRGRPSTNSRWGNHVSVLAGDWLYMQAFKCAQVDRNFHILDLVVDLTQQMVEGELMQLSCLRKLDVTEEQYLDLAFRKTACLFSVCMRLGAVVAGQTKEVQEQLGAYGTNFGLAFQLTDDVLDFTSSEDVLGKPTGSDLREGKVTLPLIYLLRRCRPDESHKVATVLEEGGFFSVQFGEIVELVERHGTLQAARDKAQEFAARARGSLDGLPQSPYRDALRSLPENIVDREF